MPACWLGSGFIRTKLDGREQARARQKRQQAAALQSEFEIKGYAAEYLQPSSPRRQIKEYLGKSMAWPAPKPLNARALFISCFRTTEVIYTKCTKS